MDGAPTSPTGVARAYYRALDQKSYDRLAHLLARSFTHERPDRTLEGRERFLTFMREERPVTDTSHAVDRVYVPAETADAPDADEADATGDVVVQGRLLDSDGELLVRFVDVFVLAAGEVTRIRTFTQ